MTTFSTGGLRGRNARLLEPEGQFFLVEYRSCMDDIQDGLLSFLGRILHLYGIIIHFGHKYMNIYLKKLHILIKVL